MADPSLIVRIASDLKELRKNLQEGKDLIEVTSQGMAKLAKGLSGERLTQQAHNITAAIHEIGGVAKLTTDEAARMQATLEKFIDKSARMGTTVPAGILHTRDALVAVAAAELKAAQDADRLEKELRDVQAEAKRADDALKTMVSELRGDRVAADAHRAVAAIQEIGGAAKLTKAEAKALKDTIDQFMEKAALTGQEIPAVMRQTQAALAAVNVEGQKQQTWLQSSIGRIKEYAIGYAAGMVSMQAFEAVGRQVIDFLKESVTEFLEAEQTHRKLTAALAAQGLATPGIIKQYDALAEHYAEISVHSDDAIRSIEALLTEVGGVMPSEMAKALEAVTDLAAGLGIDLQQAATMVAKAFEDGFGSLKKAGVTIDETRAKAEGMPYVLDEIQKRFSGQRQAEVESYAGQIKNLAKAWDQFKEDVGFQAADSGILGAGLTLARFAMADLNDKFLEGLAAWNMLKSAFTEGMTSTSPAAWARKFAEELAKLKFEMAKTAFERKQALTGGDGRVSQEEFWTGLGKEEDKFAEESRKRMEKAQKDAEAIAEQIRKTRQASVDQMTGKAFQAELKNFVLDFTAAMKKTGITLQEEIDKQVATIDRFRREGATLPPAIMSWFNTQVLASVMTGTETIQRHLAKTAISVEQLVLSARKSGLKIAADWKAVFAGAMSGSSLAAGATAGRDEFDRQQRDIQKLNVEFRIANELIRAVGQSATGAFRQVMAGISGATNAIFQYILGMKAAKAAQDATAASAAALSLTMAGVTFGISAIIGAIAGEKAQTAELKRRREELTKELEALGYTYKQFRDAQKAMTVNAGGNSLSFSDRAKHFDELKERLRAISAEVSAGIEKAQAALVNFGGKAPQALQPLIAELLKAKNITDEQRKALEGMAGAPHWKDLQARAQELGIELASLGDKFNSARIKDIAFGYVRDLTMFSEAGADADGVLRGMADELSKLAAESLKTLQPLPKQLEPFIAKLREMGLLVDENGNAIGDLTFKDMEDESLAAVRDVLMEIRDLLAKALPQAAQAAVDGMNRSFGGLRAPGLLAPTVEPGFNVGFGGSRGVTGTGSSVSNGGRIQIVVPVNIDGREAARAVTPYLTDEVDYMGLARA